MRKASSEQQDSKGKISNSSNPRNTGRLAESGIDQGIPYNIDGITSPYGLQVALKNLKDRYQKVQKKISNLEEENTQLLGGKSELFGEIGKMQENSIKLREKNLKLNHELHAKQQECCSLREKCSKLTKENLRLTSEVGQISADKNAISNELGYLEREWNSVKEKINKLLCRFEGANLPPDFIAQLNSFVKDSRQRPPNITSVNIPQVRDDSSSGDDFDQISITSTSDSSFEIYSLEQLQGSMKLAAAQLQDQQNELLHIRDTFSTSYPSVESDDDYNYTSRLATCNSVIPSGLSSCPEMEKTHREESLKEELMEQVTLDRSKSPFDWRNVEISDEDMTKPTTRTVSTSPDHALHDVNSEEERTCPMCNAVFPFVVSQDTFESHVVAHFEGDNIFEMIT